MMHQKAVLFGDEMTAQKILDTQEPRVQKALGRKVGNFNEKIWNRERLSIVKRGNSAKFSQNLKLRMQLLGTHPRELVEASPHDKIWGIGLKANDNRAMDKKQWRGQNLLGQALTEVRNELMAQN